MRNSMKICMAAPYDIKNARSWSGTPLSLYSAMNSYDENEITTLDLSEYHNAFNVRMNALKHFDFKESVKAKHLISKFGPSAMNSLNSKLLHTHCSKKDFDVLLEFGGFQPKDSLPPYYVYTDSSHDLKLDYFTQYGYMPFGSENDSLESVKRAAENVRKIYQQAQGVFCMSQWLADSMINTTGVSPDKVHTVYAGANWHGVQIPEINSSKDICGKNEIHLLLVGVQYQLKGVDLAVDAVNLLNKGSDKTFYLHVCGINESNLHTECDYIINHGFVDKQNLTDILQQCDLFVLPSRFDCFGIAFVEAMTFGLPCIGRKICAMPEIIDEGINGELVDRDDPVQLAGLITKICNDSETYRRYSENAVKKSERFTWGKVAENIMSVIKSDILL